MTCEHCGLERELGSPCPSCKFQPYDESSPDPAPTAEPTPEEIDQYEICPTPPELALAICRRIAESGINPERILEPSAGDGAFVRAAREVWPESYITAVEIRGQCHNGLFTASANHTITDSLESAFVSGAAEIAEANLVVGNPPFSLAENHIRPLLSVMRSSAVLAFLLRTGFYESHTRIPFWNEFPEDSFAPIVPRPSFRLNSKGKKGTDSQSYGLFIWTAGSPRGDHAVLTRPQRAPHIVWRDPAPRGRKKLNRQEPQPAPEIEPEVFDLE